MIRIILSFLDSVRDCAGNAVSACRHHICHGQSFGSIENTAFKLMGCQCSSPQKVFL